MTTMMLLGPGPRPPSIETPLLVVHAGPIRPPLDRGLAAGSCPGALLPLLLLQLLLLLDHDHAGVMMMRVRVPSPRLYAPPEGRRGKGGTAV